MGKWSQPDAPPPPLFTNKKERDFVKQVNDELLERVIGQQILYYAIDMQTTDYHALYGEAIRKNFLPPVRVHVLIEIQGSKTVHKGYGIDREIALECRFHKRRLNEDQNLVVRIGDFIGFGDTYYEIVDLEEPRDLFGQTGERFEIKAKCIRAREGLFDGK